MSGEIPDDIRAAWTWDRVPQDGGLRLSKGGVVLDERGVTTRTLFGGKRFWPWSEVAYLTWEANRYVYNLSACVKGDPYVKGLAFGHRSYRVCRALLQDCEPFVTQQGSRVRNTIDAAAPMWWIDQPEAH